VGTPRFAGFAKGGYGTADIIERPGREQTTSTSKDSAQPLRCTSGTTWP